MSKPYHPALYETYRNVTSTTDTSGTGTLTAIPVSLPFSSGMTFPIALAAPVDAGMMFWKAALPSLQSFPLGQSRTRCVAVTACTVVMRPSMTSKLSWTIFIKGARQLVVQLAVEITCMSVS